MEVCRGGGGFNQGCKHRWERRGGCGPVVPARLGCRLYWAWWLGPRWWWWWWRWCVQQVSLPLPKQSVHCCAHLALWQALYKNFLSVHKVEGGKLTIGSVVLRVTALEGSSPLFPNDSPHSRCYLVVDPSKRSVTVFYNAFVPFW